MGSRGPKAQGLGPRAKGKTLLAPVPLLRWWDDPSSSNCLRCLPPSSIPHPPSPSVLAHFIHSLSILHPPSSNSFRPFVPALIDFLGFSLNHPPFLHMAPFWGLFAIPTNKPIGSLVASPLPAFYLCLCLYLCLCPLCSPTLLTLLHFGPPKPVAHPDNWGQSAILRARLETRSSLLSFHRRRLPDEVTSDICKDGPRARFALSPALSCCIFSFRLGGA